MVKLSNDEIIQLYQLIIKDFDYNAISVLNNFNNDKKKLNDFIKLIHQNIR